MKSKITKIPEPSDEELKAFSDWLLKNAMKQFKQDMDRACVHGSGLPRPKTGKIIYATRNVQA